VLGADLRLLPVTARHRLLAQEAGLGPGADAGPGSDPAVGADGAAGGGAA
jgi:hypothetical protein